MVAGAAPGLLQRDPAGFLAAATEPRRKKHRMYIVRYGEVGAERPAVLVHPDSSQAFDISGLADDIDVAFFDGQGLSRVREALAAGDLPEVNLDGQRIGSPIARPGSIWAIGLNYEDHAAEAGMEVPDEPLFFNKAPNTIVGPTDDIIVPRGATKLDWEAELGIVVQTRSSYLTDEGAAADVIAGYVAVNDVTERSWQLERGGQWVKGKSFPTSNPTGPWLVTPDAIDPAALGIRLDVNGRNAQLGNTADMVFGPTYLVWYLSQFLILEPGDLIITGTPAGVGYTTSTFLSVGDVMELEIDGLGRHKNHIAALT
jgi:2,4-diketo-3-deoxy-L-fuconate hydrolase